MAVVYYPAIVEVGPGPGYGVFFPDLPGCVSAGDTLQETARNAEIALQLHIAGMIEDGERIPPASELDAIPRDHEIAEAARILVRGELPNRLERINITMDEGLLKVIDVAAEARGMTRSGFLAEGARRLLARKDEKSKSGHIKHSASTGPKGKRRLGRDAITGRLAGAHAEKQGRRAGRKK